MDWVYVAGLGLLWTVAVLLVSGFRKLENSREVAHDQS